MSVMTQLEFLPRKVRLPLQQLIKIDQLDESSLAIILDAGNRAGHLNGLLGFAVGYLHMKHVQHIPVDDVIKMAEQQHRRIRLDWSPKRWQQEHDQLSRIVTLRRLSAENVDYDVTVFQECWPEPVNGYLIRTSRRLGMEGLRQRHCVASYHDRLVAGSCAIASVFVDHKRWTVQLFSTDNPDQPLCISQIKGRYNCVPATAVRRRINEMFGIPWQEPVKQEVAPQEHRYFYTDHLYQLLPVLRQHGIRQVSVDFDGCGDSGSIDGVYYEPSGTGAGEAMVEVVSNAIRFDENQRRWVPLFEPVNKTLDDALEALTYDYLEYAGVDWYNNDGGFGSLRIDVEAGSACLGVDSVNR